MKISAKANVLGLLACPIGHSVSPVMHNYFAESLGMDEVYVPFLTQKEGLSEAVFGAYAMNVLGLNVTVPHKVAVMEYVKELDETARMVGAVNTLVRIDGGYKGYNTDMPGLTRSITEQGVAIKGSHAILIGAGGAANAAAAMFVKEQAESLYILNRTASKAESLAQHVNEMAGREMAQALSYQELDRIDGYGTKEAEGKYLMVQTTSCGMNPDVDGCVTEDRKFFTLAHTAVDIIFNPSETKFMRYAKEAGAKTIGGLKMLLYQGVLAFELWNQITVPDEVIAGAYEQMERALGL